MSILLVPKYRWLVLISFALLIALTVGLWLTNYAPAYGQGRANRIPDLKGQWQGEIEGYMFKNSLNSSDVPIYVQGPSDELILSINFQTGRAFYGTSQDGATITGVISPDGTIRIQALGEGELRGFGTCTLAIERGHYVMTGTLDMFDDLHAGVNDPDMGTFLFRGVKLD